jgi:hypothetical protein
MMLDFLREYIHFVRKFINMLDYAVRDCSPHSQSPRLLASATGIHFKPLYI